jgi:hypothetical protein
VLVVPYFGMFVRPIAFFVLFITMVNFGDCSRTVLAFFAPGNDAHDVASSWKTEVWL